jgi:hypothetical protein
MRRRARRKEVTNDKTMGDLIALSVDLRQKVDT